MKNLKLNANQIKIVIESLQDRIRYKGVRELLQDIHEQLEIEELYQKHRELQKDKELYENNYKEWTNKSNKILCRVDELKRSELTDTE